MQQTNIENKSLDPPIFIISHRRSGSHLLENILSKHKNIHTVKNEAEIFMRDKKVWIFSILDSYEQNKDFEKLTLSILSMILEKRWLSLIMGKTINDRFPQEAIAIFNEIKSMDNFVQPKTKYEIFDLCAKHITLRNNKKRWVQRSANNIYNASFILKLYPNAKFVEIYRDPRAVYCSYESRANTTNLFLFNWCKSIKEGEKISKAIPAQHYRICYENLVQTPEYELKKLCGFLDEDFDPDMLNIKMVNSSFYRTPSEQNGFSTVPINLWKNSLTVGELLFIDLITKRLRKKLNYPNSKIKLSVFNFTALIIFLIKKSLIRCAEDIFELIYFIRSISGIKISYFRLKLISKYLFTKTKFILNRTYKSILPNSTNTTTINGLQEKIIYLTINNSPSIYMKQKVDYLLAKKIPAIFFCQGNLIELMLDDVIYAIKKGFIIGNIPYHNRLSSRTPLATTLEHIKKTDELIETAYTQANIQRPIKLFRFPFGDKGGKNKTSIQNYLRELGYRQPIFKGITHDFFYICGLDKEQDVYWTYDLKEYETKNLNKILRTIENKSSLMEGGLGTPGSSEILLMHDYEKTNEIFFKVIDKLIEKKLQFRMPAFNNND